MSKPSDAMTVLFSSGASATAERKSAADTARLSAAANAATERKLSADVVSSNAAAAVSAITASATAAPAPASAAQHKDYLESKALYESLGIQIDFENFSNFEKVASTNEALSKEATTKQIPSCTPKSVFSKMNTNDKRAKLAKNDNVKHALWYSYREYFGVYSEEDYEWSPVIHQYVIRLAIDNASQKPIITVYFINQTSWRGVVSTHTILCNNNNAMQLISCSSLPGMIRVPGNKISLAFPAKCTDPRTFSSDPDYKGPSAEYTNMYGFVRYLALIESEIVKESTHGITRQTPFRDSYIQFSDSLDAKTGKKSGPRR